MRKIWCILFFTLFVTGCNGSIHNIKNSGSPYTIWFTPSDHVEKLLQEEAPQKASEVYTQHTEAFDVNKPEIHQLLTLLVEKLQAEMLPQAKQTVASLQAICLPLPMEKWADYKQTLEGATATIDKLNAHTIFQHPQFRPVIISELEKETKRVQQLLHQQASQAFMEFTSHSPERNFFEAYPIPLAEQTVINANSSAIIARLQKADPSHCNEFAQYAHHMNPEDQQRAGSIVFTKFCHKKNDLAVLLTAFTKTKEAGFTLDTIPGGKVSFVQITSPTLLKEKQIDFPIAIQVDMPFDAIKQRLHKALFSEKTQHADYVVLISVALAKAQRHPYKQESIASQYQNGFKETPNPEYAALERELETKRAELNSALRSAAFAFDALVQLAYSIKINFIENEIEDIDEKLRQMSPTCKEPKIDDYKYTQVFVDAKKNATVNYYVIDKRAMKMVSGIFDAEESQSFKVGYGLHPHDLHAETLFDLIDTEETVKHFEDQAIEISLSSIMDQYISRQHTGKKLKNFEKVYAQLTKDQNAAVARAEANTFSVTAAFDPRFDHVVKIRSSDSIGSGFYVAQNLVLTNYHVVGEEKYLTLKRFDKRETYGRVIATDMRRDLALLKVEERGDPVTFFTGNTLNYGDTIEVLGHPQNFEFSITRGIVSSIRKERGPVYSKGDKVLFIQTDASINQGNSGGPVFLGNAVVGVSDWKKLGANGNPLTINFAIHYSEVLAFLKENNVTPRMEK